MADDQKPKTMDINDLVRELSKSSTSPVAPSTPTDRQTSTSQASRSSFPTSKPPISSSSGESLAGSPLPSAPKSFIPPTPPIPPLTSARSTTPEVKQYQSSIRTMNEDISKIKQGQKPMGIDVPRKVEQVVPVPQPMSPKPAPPAGGPNQQFRVPGVNLGGSQKTAPMAQMKDVPKPSTAPKVEPKSQIYIPESGQKGGNRNMLFMGIGALALVAGLSYWFFVLRSPTPEVVIETPTPTPTATPTPDLASILGVLESQTPCTVKCSTDEFVKNINNGTINGGQFNKIYLDENDTSGNLSRVLGDLDIIYPTQLQQQLGPDSFVLVYGQKELYDSRGVIKPTAPVEKKLVFISEVMDSSGVLQSLSGWEADLPIALQKLLGLIITKQGNPQFSDNNYTGSVLRYRNFPWPDKSIDYGIVSAINGRTYLIVAGSREAMYATMDKLKGL